MKLERERVDYRPVIRAYHALPLVALVMLIAVFVGVAFPTGNNFIAALAAAVPTVLLLSLWVLAGRRLDRWVCASCGKPFSKRMYWAYPPKACPSCGDRLLEKETPPLIAKEPEAARSCQGQCWLVGTVCPLASRC